MTSVKEKKKQDKRQRPKELQKEQGPNFWGNPSFSGTGNYGMGGYKQLAHFGLNPATQEIQNQEQEELSKNLDRQEKIIVGKGYRGSFTPSPVPHWDGRNGTVETVAEINVALSPSKKASSKQEKNKGMNKKIQEQGGTQDNSVSRMRDLPGFPKINTLAKPKAFVPANDTPTNTDPSTGDKAKYLGPTLNGKELIEDPESLVHEMLGNWKAVKNPLQQGWNNQRINSLVLRRNHINPENEPPEMWHPMFKDPVGEHNPTNIVRDKVENMNSSNNNQNRPSRTPAWSMGSIGYPKQYVPQDYEQSNPNYSDIIQDPIGTRRLQSPVQENHPSPDRSKKHSRSSVNSIYGSQIPDDMGGAMAFEKSRQSVLKNLIEFIVEDVLREYFSKIHHDALNEQGTLAGKRGARKMPGFGGAANTEGQNQPQPLDLEGLRKLLNTKSPESLNPQEINMVIDYVSAKNDLISDFRSMSEEEIQKLETVLDKNIAPEKMAPFYNKIEIARADKHLKGLAAANQKQTQPTPTQKKKQTTGGGVQQKMFLPKQPLSQQFTNAVQQYYNQITNATGLSKQQKERLIQQLGQIQFDPDSSENSKLKRIQDLVRVGVGTRVEFPQPTPRKTIPAVGQPGQLTQTQVQNKTQPSGGFLGTAKRFLGLNEDGFAENESDLKELKERLTIPLSNLVVHRSALMEAMDHVFYRKSFSKTKGPLIVLEIEDEPGNYQLIDGYHRLVEYLATQKHKKTQEATVIPVIVDRSSRVHDFDIARVFERWRFDGKKKYGNLEDLADNTILRHGRQAIQKKDKKKVEQSK